MTTDEHIAELRERISRLESLRTYPTILVKDCVPIPGINAGTIHAHGYLVTVGTNHVWDAKTLQRHIQNALDNKL